MKRRVLLISFVVALGTWQFVAVASDTSSKKQESAESPKVQAVPSKSKPVEPPAKREEPVKWDQLDPKSLESRTKVQQTPFAKVPAER